MPTRHLLVALLISALAFTVPASAELLERHVEGKFKAIGVNRLKPGLPAERVFCRLAGKKTGAATFQLAGRCATANLSGAMRITLKVAAPGARYEMDIFMATARFAGYDSTYHYTGVADASGITFETPFVLDGRRYRSSFRLSFGLDGVDRIRETVTSEADGTESALVDLRVERE